MDDDENDQMVEAHDMLFEDGEEANLPGGDENLAGMEGQFPRRESSEDGEEVPGAGDACFPGQAPGE